MNPHKAHLPTDPTVTKETPRMTPLSRFANRIASFAGFASVSPSSISTLDSGDDSVTTGAAMASRGPSEARTQGGGVAALLTRLRTQHRAVSAAVSVVAVGAGAFLMATPAQAATSSPAWHVTSVAQPTNFTEADLSDEYLFLLDNVGQAPSAGTVTLTDHLPPGVTTSSTPEVTRTGGTDWSCSPGAGQSVFTCTFTTPVPGLESTDSLRAHVQLSPAAPASLENHVTVEGGLTPTFPTDSATELTANTTAAPSGPDLFDFAAFGPTGAPDLQAADHPVSLATTVHFADIIIPPLSSDTQGVLSLVPAETTKNIVFELPPGFLGDPLATGSQRCTEAALHTQNGGAGCPPGSQVGAITLDPDGGGYTKGGEFPLFNLLSDAGFPATLGFNFHGTTILVTATLGPAPFYALRLAAPALPGGIRIHGFSVLIFGDPAQHDGSLTPPRAFLTDPARCSAEPLAAKLTEDSWQSPDSWHTAESTVFPEVTGCDQLRFKPSLKARPTTSVADSPSGLDVDLTVPQNEDPEGLATPPLRDAVVTLPQGLSVDPSTANGLAACAAEGPQGINVGSGNVGPEGRDLGDPEATELGAGHLGGNGSPYDDGLYHTAPGHCPAASKIATAEIETPLLEGALHGSVYLGAPECAPCSAPDAAAGKLLKLYIEIDDPATGIIAKLPGTVATDPATGRLVATFKQNPQLPFSDLKLHFAAGPRASLTTPPTCGTYTTTTDLTPWSAPPDSRRHSL